MARSTSRGVLKVIGAVALVALIGCAIAGGILFASFQHVKSELDLLKTEVDTISDTLASGDADAISASIKRIDASAKAIHGELSRPVWAIAEVLPAVGNDVKVARALSDTLRELDEKVLVPLSDASAYLTPSGYLNENGLSLDGVSVLSGIVMDAHPSVKRSLATLEALPEPQIEQLREALGTTIETLQSVDELLDFFAGLGSGISLPW